MLLREYRIEDELEARMEEGEEKGIIDSARKLLASGMSLNRIVEILELSNDHIKQLEGSAV